MRLDTSEEDCLLALFQLCSINKVNELRKRPFLNSLGSSLIILVDALKKIANAMSLSTIVVVLVVIAIIVIIARERSTGNIGAISSDVENILETA